MDGARSRKETVLKHVRTGKRPAEKEEGDDRMPEEEQPLSPAARLFHQPRFNCFIMAMIGSAKRIDVAAVKAGLEVTLLRHHRFSSILVSDRRKCVQQKWVRTKVVLDDHFVVPDVDPDMDSPDKFVEDYASDLPKTPIDMSKPLWEIHILNVRTSEAEATAIFRIHHSLGDGISLISLLLACTRKTSDLNSPPSVLETRKAVSPERRGVLWFVAILWWVMRVGWYTLMDIWVFLATAVFLKDTVTPLKGGKGIEFNPKRFVHCTFSLDDVKFIKNAMKSTVNDVFLGVTSAGLSRYLSRRYGKDEADNIGEHSLPSNIRLRATVLVNIRPTPGIYALHDMMENNKPDVNWGNRLGYVLLPFFTKIQDDVLDHVRKAKAIVDRKKLSLGAPFTFFSGSSLAVSSSSFKYNTVLLQCSWTNGGNQFLRPPCGLSCSHCLWASTSSHCSFPELHE